MIGIITVTYNSAAVIPDFMKSVLKQSYRDFRLYVVDNCSSDETLAVCDGYSDPRLIIIRNPTNVGVAEGNNIGIIAAVSHGCGYALLLNNDTVFDTDLMATLHDGLQKYQCDMIVPKILYYEAADKIWSAGGGFSRLRGRSEHIGFNKRDNGGFDQAREVEYGPTCCMLIRGEVFERIGLMDPNYFVYFDDADFCMRALRAGIKLVYTPEARLFHKVSSLIGHRSDMSVRYVTRNHVYFALKHFTPFETLYYLPVCQAHIFVRCLFTKNMAKAFLIAQKAFVEGIRVFRSAPKSQALKFPPRTRVEAASPSVVSTSTDT